ncbi:MAG TPA: nitronate monooxygenase, partial [Acidimicrobiales bacterium]
MRTPATDLVGIDVPIFGFSHCRDVVAAVTNAGGCGVLGAVAHSPEQLDVDLAWIEAEVKGKPYGVDLLVPEKFAGSDEGGLDRGALADLMPAEHKQFVDDLLARYDVPPAPEPEGPSRGMGGMRVDPKSMAPLLDVLFDHETRLVASALGPPPAHFIERAHAADIPVAALAG